MDLKKSQWIAGDNRVSLSVPISKVDSENRLVSGFATLDNIDTSDDVVTAEASHSAFSNFRGNIREMHQPIAAGRMVDFQEDEFYHDGEFFRGVFVTAYVSKGAADTWEKVLDGTLSGFSIGGNITEQETKFVKDAGPNGKNIRFITNYDLVELSLVDNPANQLANVFSIVKSNGVAMMKGMVTETEITNVFWCPADEIAKNSTSESETCLSCGNAMEQIGWFEQGGNHAEKTASAVSNFLRKREAETNTVTSEGGVEMTNTIKKDADTGADDVVTSDEVVDEAEVEAEGAQVPEDSAEVAAEQHAEREAQAEVVDETPAEPDFEKMFDDLKVSVTDSVEKTVKAVDEKVNEATKAFDEKASEFEKSLTELSARLEDIKTGREDVAKRLDALEKASAIKKSGEVESTEPVKKAKQGLWTGTFFDTDA